MTIGTNYSNATYIDPALYAQAKVNGMNYNDVVATKAVGATQADSFVGKTSETCTDGKDDGKIGFFEGVGNFFKGAAKGLVNGVKGMFLDENGKFSLKNTLKSAVTIGACFIPVVGPYIAGGLCVIGAVKGGAGMIKSVGNAIAADTDAEAKAALQSLGGSTLATGLSVAGLKGSAGAIAKSTGFTSASGAGSVSKMLNAARTSAGRGQILSGMKNSFTNYYGSAWNNGIASANGASSLSKNLAGAKAVIKEGAKGTAQNVVGTAKAIKNKATDTANKITGKTGTGSADKLAKTLSSKGNKVTAEQIQEALNNGGKLQVGNKTYNLSQAGDDIAYSLQKTQAKTSAWESTKGSSELSENLTTKEFVNKYKNSIQKSDYAHIKNLEPNSTYVSQDGLLKITKGADGKFTVSAKTNPTLTKTTTYNNVSSKDLSSFKYKQLIKHNKGNVSYSDNTLTIKSEMPTSVAKVNEFIHNDPIGQVKSFVQKTAPKTYAKVGEHIKNNPQSAVAKTVDSIQSLNVKDVQSYINGVESAQTIDRNAFIAKMVQDIE